MPTLVTEQCDAALQCVAIAHDECDGGTCTTVLEHDCTDAGFVCRPELRIEP